MSSNTPAPNHASDADIARELAQPGRNALAYVDRGHNPDRPVTLHTYRSQGYAPDRPLVIVQHGMLRNGDDYRDFWIPAADRYGLLVVAPTFSNEAWKGADSYNNGTVFDTPDSSPRPVDDWAYALVGRVVDALRAAGVSRGKTYLFGHSAGGQFVHRLMSSQPHERFHAVACANAGWYTLPSFDCTFPEGLGGAGLSDAHLARLLAYPLTILAGDQDTATDDPNLPSGAAALRQGPHRYARAQNYLQAGRREAAARGLSCNWSLQPVPGIGHNGRAMSAACAGLWFEGRLPSAAALAELAGNHVA